LSSGASLAAGNLTSTQAFDFASPSFIRRNDNCVTVSDTFNTGTPTTLGSPCVGDGTPTSFTYAHTVDVPANGCQSFPNTATFTTNSSGTTGSASQSVQACYPLEVTLTPHSQSVVSGGTASWHLTATNLGSVPLTVSVLDNVAPLCQAFGVTVIPGETITIVGCMLANVTAGFTNVVTANGDPPSGPRLTASDSADVTVS